MLYVSHIWRLTYSGLIYDSRFNSLLATNL